MADDQGAPQLSTGISAEPQQPQQEQPQAAAAPITGTPNPGDFVDNPNYKAQSTESSDFVDNPNYKAPEGEKPESALTMHPGDNPLVKTAKGVGGVFSGLGEGLFSTAAGIADIAHAPQQARDLLHHIAGDDEKPATAEKIGYGGETLAEFLLGDEALKALPMAKRLEVAAKSMKVVEGSPRLVQALKVGTKILKLASLHGAEAGIVGGTQAAVRTPGTLGEKVEEGAKEGAETAAGGTALGVPLEAIGEGLQAAGKVAGKVKNLSDVAEGAKGKEEIVQELGNRIKGAKAQMNGDFEEGINDLKDRLKGSDIDAQSNPLAAKAKELLAKPNPEEHPLVAEAKNAAGDKLDKPVQKLLQMAAKGSVPIEPVPVEEAPTILDSKGNPIKSTTDLTPPTEKPLPNYNIDDLVKFRQTIRSLADSYELGDINGRVLRKLNNSVDDTIGELAKTSGDSTALGDYQKLRADYRDKVNLFDDPVIEKLHDGKVDDAARAFVGLQRSGSALPSAGKTVYNTDVLKRVIGEDGVKAFGKDVFGTMLKDSTENGRINPAKFAQSWDRITEQTKGDLFDINNATNGLNQLAKDAKAGETLQHLTRLGVLGTAGATAGGFIHPLGMGLGTLLGLTVAEGGGISAGRDLLNYIANHPKVWSAYEAAGKAAENSTGTIPKVAAYAGTKAVNQNKTALKHIYDQTATPLGGKASNNSGNSFFDLAGSSIEPGEAGISAAVQLPKHIEALVDKYAHKYSVPTNLARAVVFHESRGDPKAVGKTTSKGEQAKGLGQLLPNTAKEMGVMDPFDPEQNLNGAMKYLGNLYAQHDKNPLLAYAAYTSGPNRVKKGDSIQDVLKKLPHEGQKGVRKVAQFLGANLDEQPAHRPHGTSGNW